MKTQTKNDGVFNYDYQNGMDKMSPKEQQFISIMEKQSRYPFLRHKERSPEENKRVINRIHERIKKFQTAILSLTLLIAMGLTIVSCERDTPQRELITQEVKMTNILVTQMNKSFDPNTWVYNYNPGAYTLTFQNINNPAETVTRQTTINELINGITVTIYSGQYNITYQTTHANTTKLDIKINNPNITIIGTPIELSGLYDDFLVVFDIPLQECTVVSNTTGALVETFNILNDMRYIYFNSTVPRIKYVVNAQLGPIYVDMNTFVYGHIYWFTSPQGMGTNLLFPDWIINKTTL